MSREDIIKYEAYNILQIALKSEDDYEGHHAIIDRLNILINTLQLEDKLPSNIYTIDEEEEEVVEDEDEGEEYTVRIIEDEVIVTPITAE